MGKGGWLGWIPALVLAGHALAEPPPPLAARAHVMCEDVPDCETIGRVRLRGAIGLALSLSKVSSVMFRNLFI